MQKKIRFVLFICVLFAVLIRCNPIARANETEVSGELKQLEHSANAFAEKDTNSSVISSFKRNDYVLVLDQDEAWITIFYKGEKAYIPVYSDVTGKGEKTEDIFESVDQTSFDEEQKEIQQDEIALVNEAVVQAQKEKRIMIWRVMMISVIAVAIVVVVITIVRKNASEESM